MASYFDENTPDIVLKSLFMKYDKDGSGILNIDEAKLLLIEDLDLSKEQAGECLLMNDHDGNGTLSYDEFKLWLNQGEGLKNFNDSSRYYLLHQAVLMFRKYDTNANGSLDREEFERVLADVGVPPNKVQEGIDALDANNDNIISFPEFMKWLNWLPL